jgi:dTMP kinase
MRGAFITFEGGEGSGKSSYVKMLGEWLNDLGHRTIVTKDPGGTPIANKIRQIVLDGKNTNLSRTSELLLYLASRAQLIDEIIKPAIDDEINVVCDRFADSTAVYQGILRDWDDETIENMNDLVTEGYVIWPDLTFICDVSAQIGLSRSMQVNLEEKNNESRWEDMGLPVHKTINQGFRDLVVEAADIGEEDRFVILNCNDYSIEENFEIIKSTLTEVYSLDII